MKLIYLSLIVIFFFSCSNDQGKHNPKSDKMDEIITISQDFDISVELAFDYFTKEELITQWLTVKANIELTEGGDYELFWTPDDPDQTNNSTYGCKILAFEKPYFLNVEWRGNADHKSFMNNVRPLTNVTVHFNKIGENSTKITLLHTGWRKGEDWDTARQYFINAWNGAFTVLKSRTQQNSTRN